MHFPEGCGVRPFAGAVAVHNGYYYAIQTVRRPTLHVPVACVLRVSSVGAILPLGRNGALLRR